MIMYYLNKLMSFQNLKTIIAPRIAHYKPLISNSVRCYAKSSKDLNDTPIKFSTSDAIYGIREERLRRIQMDTTPWYQGYVCTVSFAVFLIYFCVIREENDIDIELSRSLYSRVEGLEETGLKVAKEHYLQNKNMEEVRKINIRLKELGAAV